MDGSSSAATCNDASLCPGQEHGKRGRFYPNLYRRLGPQFAIQGDWDWYRRLDRDRLSLVASDAWKERIPCLITKPVVLHYLRLVHRR